jgi:hypothetical protein
MECEKSSLNRFPFESRFDQRRQRLAPFDASSQTFFPANGKNHRLRKRSLRPTTPAANRFVAWPSPGSSRIPPPPSDPYPSLTSTAKSQTTPRQNHSAAFPGPKDYAMLPDPISKPPRGDSFERLVAKARFDQAKNRSLWHLQSSTIHDHQASKSKHLGFTAPSKSISLVCSSKRSIIDNHPHKELETNHFF